MCLFSALPPNTVQHIVEEYYQHIPSNQYKAGLEFAESDRAFLDQATAGNLQSTQEKPPLTKTVRFHANRTSAGRVLLSNGFHPGPLLQPQKDWWAFERESVVGGSEEKQLC